MRCRGSPPGKTIEDRNAEPLYPQFTDGLRQLTILEAELRSHRRRGWVDVSGDG